MDNWWDRYSGQLEFEKNALTASGYSWKLDQSAFASGQVRIEIAVEADDEKYTLIAVYPDTYPYFPPVVSRAGTPFQRHHHLFGGNLCLLARDGEQWSPGHDTLATLLDEQLPKLLRVIGGTASDDFVAANEDHVAEAFASFLPYVDNCSLVVPDETPPSDVAFGRISIHARPDRAGQAADAFLNGVVTKISDVAGNTLIQFPLAQPDFTTLRSGFWVRLPERPVTPVLAEGKSLQAYFFEMLQEKVPAFKKAFECGKRGQIIVGGFVYADEVRWRKDNADDWFFLAARIVRERKGAKPAQGTLFFVKADWGGENARVCRAPALRPLREKTVVVIGLGSLGSPLVLQLARAGIRELHLLDYDQLQVGNFVRWALGWRFAGIGKTVALGSHLQVDYPKTKVFQYPLRLGDVDSTGYETIFKMISNADLIVDASANPRVSHFLSDLSRGLNRPYLWLTTTHGTAGGIVGRVIPGRTPGCWHCYLRHLADKTIVGPADSGEDEIQPGGCSQPTFIGAGIDSDEVALMASRLSVATLCVGESGGYPDFPFDVAVVDLYSDGKPLAPCWTEYSLPVHQECPACSGK